MPNSTQTPNLESYKLVKIPKKRKGEFREICIPNSVLKDRLRVRNFELNKESLKFGGEIQGFCPGRSPCSNAVKHIGYNFTLSFDLKDFFDTIRPDMVDIKWSDCFINGRAYQGLPTSPAIANLAAIPMDKQIINWINDYISNILFHGESEKIVYTRYADDLTFSFNYYETYLRLRRFIPEIVEDKGFTINPRKTHLQTAKFGRRIITGVAVDAQKIYIPREIKRKMRTAKYHQQFKRFYGLQEWSKLKMPNSSCLTLNSMLFNDLNEYNRITNMMMEGKDKSTTITNAATGNTIIFNTGPFKNSTNYNFIGPIKSLGTKDLSSKKKKLVEKKRLKNKQLLPSDLKKEWKRRSKFVFKEIAQDPIQQKILDIIRNSSLNKLRENPEKDLTQEQFSDKVVGNQDLAEDLLS